LVSIACPGAREQKKRKKKKKKKKEKKKKEDYKVLYYSISYWKKMQGLNFQLVKIVHIHTSQESVLGFSPGWTRKKVYIHVKV